MAILNMDDASFPFLFLLNQNAATGIPSVIIKNELTDWNQVAGTVQFRKPITLFVFSAAYRFIKPPACSNAPQNTMIIRKDNNITLTRSFSIAVRGLFFIA